MPEITPQKRLKLNVHRETRREEPSQRVGVSKKVMGKMSIIEMGIPETTPRKT